MTVLCGGGASRPKSGVVETVVYASGALASLLNNKGGGWAVLVAPLLGVVAYSAEDLCTTDPPDDPNLTAEDYLHLLHLDDFGAVATATAKLAQLVKRWIWFEVCECESVATPAPPAGEYLPPTGISNPQSSTIAPCWTSTASKSPFAYTTSPAIEPTGVDFNAMFPASAPRHILSGGPYAGHEVVARDASWTSVRLAASLPAGAPPSASNTRVGLMSWTSLTPAGTSPIGSAQLATGADPTRTVHSFEASMGSNPYVSMFVYSQGPSFPSLVDINMDLYCGGSVAGGASTPCASDPAVLALLQQILSLVTVTQRHAVPFAYIPGEVLTGLTGAGFFSVQGLVSLQVEFTTLPNHYGLAEGAPDRLFDVGFISLGTDDGYQPPQRITTSPFYMRVGSEITSVGYTFPPDIVATIRQFRREA